MVNEEKVILMTKLASYEAGEGKKYISIASYFRSDYISLQVLKAVIYGTIAFGIAIAVVASYKAEFFIQDIYKVDLLQLGKSIGLIYIVCIGVYALIAYILASYRYNRAKQSLRTYYNNLKKITKFYE